jgi:hypothetical protein
MSDNSKQVAAGQVWADNDARSAGRTLRVDKVIGEHAWCMVLTDMEQRATGAKTTVGKSTRIKLSRFRPTSTGYRYLRDAEAASDADPA